VDCLLIAFGPIFGFAIGFLPYRQVLFAGKNSAVFLPICDLPP